MAEVRSAVKSQFAICDRCSGVNPRRSGSATSFRAIAVTRAISDPAAATLDVNPGGCCGTTPSRMRAEPIRAS